MPPAARFIRPKQPKKQPKPAPRRWYTVIGAYVSDSVCEESTVEHVRAPTSCAAIAACRPRHTYWSVVDVFVGKVVPEHGYVDGVIEVAS